MAGKFGGELNLADWPGQENYRIGPQIQSVRSRDVNQSTSLIDR